MEPGGFSDGQETLRDRPESERTGRFSDSQETSGTPDQSGGRYSTGQEARSENAEHTMVGSFSDGQEATHGSDGGERSPVQNDHGLPKMSFRTAFARRNEITPRASELGLIERANREVFHDRGFTMTWDTETGDIWLTPTDHPEGWWYEEDVG